jgi:hypothetical protein
MDTRAFGCELRKGRFDSFALVGSAVRNENDIRKVLASVFGDEGV